MRPPATSHREPTARDPARALTATRPALRARELPAADWPHVAAIRREGIAAGAATLETEIPSRDEWDSSHLSGQRLAGEQDGAVAGRAALAPVSARACDAGVAGTSVSVAAEARGRGVASTLLAALVEGAERAGPWTTRASVFPENEASLALHRRLALRVVGVRERLGRPVGAWRETVPIERRSGVAGAG